MARLPIIQAEEAVEQAFSPLPYESSLSPRRVYIDTFGCQMNHHDSQRMVSMMAAEGYLPTDHPDDADLVIINSCSVREKAEHKLLSRAGQMKRVKRQNTKMILALGGCVAQQEGAALLDRVHHADIVFGPDHLARLPEMIREVEERRVRIHRTEFLDKQDYEFPPIRQGAPREVSAYISVMKGCDKFCTFCIVPFTRGREISRSAGEIIEEARILAANGTKEVVLLGQTVNSYGTKKKEGQIPFSELLYRVAELDGIERIRFTSPHPSDFTEDQILAYRDLPKLCPHMHLPVQSGSDRILAAMRRGYTRQQYLAIVDRLREVAPGVALTTDVIVGFPGETDEDFELTLSLLEEVRFQGAFSFAYSERVGTRALKMEPAVAEEVRFERLRILQTLQDRITQEWLEAMVGQTHRVMIEGPSKTDPLRSSGRTGQNRPVHVQGRYEPGTMLDVRIVEAYKHSLLGAA